MSGTLTDELQSVVQRSGTNTGSMRTEAERASFSSNVRKDIASLVYQMNTVYKPLVENLSSTATLDALDFGISGNTVFTHVNATAADASAFYSSSLSRALTVKETVDILLSEISRLENELQSALAADAIDEAALAADIQTNLLNIQQIAGDSFGPLYTLDGDGAPDLVYSLSQTIDAIGALFTGYSSTGLSYSSTYPALSIAQSGITDLSAHLGNIRSFVGMSSAADASPTYSAYGGTLNTIADGDSLEEAIHKLDQSGGGGGGATTTIQQAYDNGAAGSAGELQLLNAKGGIKLRDDASSPLGIGLQFYNNAGNESFRISTAAIQLFQQAVIRIGSRAGDPAAGVNRGSVYTRPDATTSHVELFYQHSGTAGGVQITNNGFVQEHLVSETVIYPATMVVKTTASSPAVEVWDFSDMATKIMAFPSASPSTAYMSVPIPVDKDGLSPTKYRVTMQTVVGPSGGVYVSGSGFTFDLYAPSTSSTVPHGAQIDNAWGGAATQNTTGMGAGAVHDLRIVQWPVDTLTSNPLGVLNLKLTRNTVNVLDNWLSPIGVLAITVSWYR